MYQRSGAIHTANATHGHGTPLGNMVTKAGVGGGGAAAPGAKTTLTKKLILWMVLLLQVCFIGCLWLLQLGGGSLNAIDGAALTTGGVVAGGGAHRAERVNFIQKAASLKLLERPLKQAFHHSRQHKPRAAHVNWENVCNFSKDFYLKPNRLNQTGVGAGGRGGEAEMALAEELTPPLWCFREGTLNETERNGDGIDTYDWDDVEQQCKCVPGWHGRDCGQPEVVWRALIARKGTPFVLLQPSKTKPHRLLYMLEGNFFNLDLLELQIKAVDEVVDYFFIYAKNCQAKREDTKALERRVRELLSQGSYTIWHCSQLAATRTTNCTAERAYRHLRKRILPAGYFMATDLFAYSEDYTLLSAQALKFLKYYASDVRAMRFRLKYTVYGFYWTHPALTHLTGLISSFTHLDNPLVGNQDPRQLLQNIENVGNAFTVGDLNHFGGWFCKYCQEPPEIIAQLHAEFSSSSSALQAADTNQVQFPLSGRNRPIDVAYVHKLIANGVYVDGKTQLLRVRRYSDKYYAPLYAEDCSWKFGNLLTNLYETFDEDNEDEAVY